MSDALGIACGRFGRVALLDMDRSLVRHAHPHCHVLLKVEGDDTRFAVSDSVATLTDEHAVLVNAWEPHAYVHDPRQGRTVILALYIEPKWLADFRPNWKASASGRFFSHRAGLIDPVIRALTHDLANSLVYAPHARSEHEQLLGKLMLAVVQRFSDWRHAAPPLREAVRMDWRVRKAVGLMRADPGAALGTEGLARAVGMSRAHFFRLFGQATGMSPNIFLNMLRLETAVQAMTSSHESAGAVGERLGFSAPPHFTRFFRDHAGCTPSAFRSVSQLGSGPVQLAAMIGADVCG